MRLTGKSLKTNRKGGVVEIPNASSRETAVQLFANEAKINIPACCLRVIGESAVNSARASSRRLISCNCTPKIARAFYLLAGRSQRSHQTFPCQAHLCPRIAAVPACAPHFNGDRSISPSSRHDIRPAQWQLTPKQGACTLFCVGRVWGALSYPGSVRPPTFQFHPSFLPHAQISPKGICLSCWLGSVSVRCPCGRCCGNDSDWPRRGQSERSKAWGNSDFDSAGQSSSVGAPRLLRHSPRARTGAEWRFKRGRGVFAQEHAGKGSRRMIALLRFIRFGGVDFPVGVFRRKRKKDFAR